MAFCLYHSILIDRQYNTPMYELMRSFRKDLNVVVFLMLLIDTAIIVAAVVGVIVVYEDVYFSFSFSALISVLFFKFVTDWQTFH